jgi:hypothetical protein
MPGSVRCGWGRRIALPRTCTVCSHPEAISINEELVLKKASNRAIACQYGLNRMAVQRHREHIPQLLVKALEAEEIAQADDLVHEIKTMVHRVRAFIDKAEDADDGPEFRAHAAEWRKQVELLAKIAGELAQEGTTNIQVTIDARTQQVILDALAPHPEARIAVARALRELEAA